MQERLQKILSQAGIASRRESETIILAGRVTVNGVVVTELGSKADPSTDRITVDGKPLAITEQRVYILLYKPVGYMTTMKDPEGRPIVSDLLRGVKERVYPIGRLDYNTEGLLLLTNDGALANFLMHPSHEVDKGYLVRVSGKVSPEQMRKLAEGVRLEDGMTAPAKVLPVSESEQNSWISITIHEGRYRQVRRMCEAVGLSVVRLKRSRYDFLEIGEMKPGDFRFLTPDEVARLQRKPVPAAVGRPRKTTETGPGTGTNRPEKGSNPREKVANPREKGSELRGKGSSQPERISSQRERGPNQKEKGPSQKEKGPSQKERGPNQRENGSHPPDLRSNRAGKGTKAAGKGANADGKGADAAGRSGSGRGPRTRRS